MVNKTANYDDNLIMSFLGGLDEVICGVFGWKMGFFGTLDFFAWSFVLCLLHWVLISAGYFYKLFYIIIVEI